ncbi:MAG: hypothetical protein ACFB03_18810, partial [Paracoccaceae bacterium]
MTGDIEWCGVVQHLEGALTPQLQRSIGWRNGWRFHRRGRHQQKIIGRQNLVIFIALLPIQVLRFGVFVDSVVIQVIFSDDHS